MTAGGHVAAHLDDAYAGADGYGESASMDAILMMYPCRGKYHCTCDQPTTDRTGAARFQAAIRIALPRHDPSSQGTASV